MYIDKIVLKNFMQFDNKEVELSPGLNIIVGTNGSGKSTILDSILFGLFRRTIRTSSNISNVLKLGSNNGHVKIFMSNSNNSENKNYTIERYIKGKLIDLLYENNDKIVEGNTNVTNYIHKNIIGVDIDTYVRTLFIGQRDIVKIIDHKILYNTLDKIFNVNIIINIQKAINEYMKEIENNIKINESNIHIFKTTIKDIKNNNINTDDIDLKISSLNNKLEEIYKNNGDIDSIKNRIEKCREDILKLEKDNSLINYKLSILNKYSKYISLLKKFNINNIKPYLKYINGLVNIKVIDVNNHNDIVKELYHGYIKNIYKTNSEYKSKLVKYKNKIRSIVELNNRYNSIYDKDRYEFSKKILHIMNKYDIDIENILFIYKNSDKLNIDNIRTVVKKLDTMVDDNLNNYIDDIFYENDKNIMKVFISFLPNNCNIKDAKDKLVSLNNMISEINNLNNYINKYKDSELQNYFNRVSLLKYIEEIDDINKKLSVNSDILDKLDIIYEKISVFEKSISDAYHNEFSIDEINFIKTNISDFIKIIRITKDISVDFKSLTNFISELDKINKYKMKITISESSKKELNNEIDKLNEIISSINDIVNNLNILNENKKLYFNNKTLMDKYKKDMELLEKDNKKLSYKSHIMNKYKQGVDIYASELNSRIYGALESITLQFLDMFNFKFEDIKFDTDGILIKQNGEFINSKLLSNAQQTCLGLSLRFAISTIIDTKNKFKLLIMDEPSEGFDDIRINSLNAILSKMNNNKIFDQIIVVTHNKNLMNVSSSANIIEISPTSK